MLRLLLMLYIILYISSYPYMECSKLHNYSNVEKKNNRKDFKDNAVGKHNKQDYQIIEEDSKKKDKEGLLQNATIKLRHMFDTISLTDTNKRTLLSKLYKLRKSQKGKVVTDEAIDLLKRVLKGNVTNVVKKHVLESKENLLLNSTRTLNDLDVGTSEDFDKFGPENSKTQFLKNLQNIQKLTKRVDIIEHNPNTESKNKKLLIKAIVNSLKRQNISKHTASRMRKDFIVELANNNEDEDGDNDDDDIESYRKEDFRREVYYNAINSLIRRFTSLMSPRRRTIYTSAPEAYNSNNYGNIESDGYAVIPNRRMMSYDSMYRDDPINRGRNIMVTGKVMDRGDTTVRGDVLYHRKPFYYYNQNNENAIYSDPLFRDVMRTNLRHPSSGRGGYMVENVQDMLPYSMYKQLGGAEVTSRQMRYPSVVYKQSSIHYDDDDDEEEDTDHNSDVDDTDNGRGISNRDDQQIVILEDDDKKRTHISKIK